MSRTSLTLSCCAALFAATVLAQLSPANHAWGETAVRYLMTKQERTDWASLETDADANRFIELFWARRDPAVRQQLEKRIAEADKRFSAGKTLGSQMDQGAVYALLGEPTHVTTSVSPPRGNGYNMGQFDRPIQFETWTYKGDAAERFTGTKAFDVAFVFQDEKDAGRLELDARSRQSFEATALTIAKSIFQRPNLKAADLAPVALGMIVVADETLANDILRRAQEGEDFAGLARKYSTHPSAQHGGYLGRIAFADLDGDMKAALAGKPSGAAVLVTRKPYFAVVRLLTDAEAAAAEAGMNAPK